MDKNLKKTRHSLVPDLVSEDEFWRNYFYKIECAKAELGVQTRLGARKSNEEMVEQLNQKEAELVAAEQEEAKVAPAATKVEPEKHEIEL